MTIMLNGSDLTVTQVVSAARRGEPVALAPEAVGNMRQARAVVEEALGQDTPVYSLTTGVPRATHPQAARFLQDPTSASAPAAPTG